MDYTDRELDWMNRSTDEDFDPHIVDDLNAWAIGPRGPRPQAPLIWTDWINDRTNEPMYAL